MDRKRLGQHFLVADEKARRVVELAQIGPSENIVEIGPGKGILTHKILRKGNSLTAIELDQRLAEGIIRSYPGQPNFQIFVEDAARFDYGQLKAPFKVVSNLPYSCAVPILARLMEFKDKIPLMVLMFQLEVAQRLTALPGGKNYNPLSIFAQYHFSCTLEFVLSKKDFSPVPKVDSAVVRFVPHATPPFPVEDEGFFFELVKRSFVHRRKKMINNLKTPPFNARQVEEACEACGIDPGQRAETVSLENFARLSNILRKGSGVS